MTLMDLAWWQKGTIYQIYPRSFMDASGDGIGDLRGIQQRLEYLQWLGVSSVWLSPIFKSPMKDFGYDVSDYESVDPVFGTMDDFDTLLKALHTRGIKLILDFVPNHTSDQHPWFVESSRSRQSPRRDWYIWRDPAPDGGPPNNWRSQFGGSGWTLDEATGQYYYHAFLKEQPDLNWRNPEVRNAIYNAMRFWLNRGVDGFRMDVIWHLMKDIRFRDNPKGTQLYSTDQPEVHEIIAEMRDVLDDYSDRMMIGEIYLPISNLMAYYGATGKGVHLPFNFQLLQLYWRPTAIAGGVEYYNSALPAHGWPNWVLGNHDISRFATRVGREHTRVAAILLLTLRGTPTLYYGDELGMEDVYVPSEKAKDPDRRDPQRAPMPWTGGDHAGFSTVDPWLPLPENFREMNVAKQRETDHSLLQLYRQLLLLRQNSPALMAGLYRTVEVNDALMIYEREADEQCLTVALNFSEEDQPLPDKLRSAKILLRSAAPEFGGGPIMPHEGIIFQTR